MNPEQAKTTHAFLAREWISRQRGLQGQSSEVGNGLDCLVEDLKMGSRESRWLGSGLGPDHKMVGQRTWTRSQEQSD